MIVGRCPQQSFAQLNLPAFQRFAASARFVAAPRAATVRPRVRIPHRVRATRARKSTRVYPVQTFIGGLSPLRFSGRRGASSIFLNSGSFKRAKLATVNLRGWNERYRARPEIGPATPLLMDIAQSVPAGRGGAEGKRRALDLACGTGRNALWLSAHGWQVTAVDGSREAIAILAARNPAIDARVADLENHEYTIEPDCWDLIAMCHYLQRDLFEPAKRGVAPGGAVVAIVHIPGPGEELTRFRLNPGELAGYFQDFEILHSYEGPSRDPEHRHWVAEIAARRIK